MGEKRHFLFLASKMRKSIMDPEYTDHSRQAAQSHAVGYHQWIRYPRLIERGKRRTDSCLEIGRVTRVTLAGHVALNWHLCRLRCTLPSGLMA